MSNKRRISLSDIKRTKGFCTWCKIAVKKPKQYWCGAEECINEYRLRSDPGYLRLKVFERDQGICESCGVDTEAVLKAYNDARALACAGIEERFEALGFKLLKNAWNGKKLKSAAHLWEADHRIPVIEGGGSSFDKNFDLLGNMRTLCRPCHSAATAELAKRRKTKR